MRKPRFTCTRWTLSVLLLGVLLVAPVSLWLGWAVNNPGGGAQAAAGRWRSGAPIGTVESFDGATVNGQPVQARQLIWGGELIEARGPGTARVMLNDIGLVTLSGDTRVRLAAATEQTTPELFAAAQAVRVLVATLARGAISIKLQPEATAYCEADGRAFIASPGAHLRLALREERVVIETGRGEVFETRSALQQSDIIHIDIARPSNKPLFADPQTGVAKASAAPLPKQRTRGKDQRYAFQVIRQATRRAGENNAPGGFTRLGLLNGFANIFSSWFSVAAAQTNPGIFEPVRGTPVSFALEPASLGTVSPQRTETNQYGVVDVVFTPGTTAADGQLRVTAEALNVSRTFGLTVVSAGFWTLRNKVLISAGIAAAAAGIILAARSDEVRPTPTPCVKRDPQTQQCL